MDAASRDSRFGLSTEELSAAVATTPRRSDEGDEVDAEVQSASDSTKDQVLGRRSVYLSQDRFPGGLESEEEKEEETPTGAYRATKRHWGDLNAKQDLQQA
eukprot:1700291-Karenia_brevis.AAC.1